MGFPGPKKRKTLCRSPFILDLPPTVKTPKKTNAWPAVDCLLKTLEDTNSETHTDKNGRRSDRFWGIQQGN